MNQLITRKGPDFYFIIEKHRNKVEKAVLEEFFAIAEAGSLKNEIPFVGDISLDPRYYYAGVLNWWHGKPDLYFENQNKFINDEDFVEFVYNDLDAYAESDMRGLQGEHSAFMEDIESVLEFHHLCYVGVNPNPFKPLSYVIYNSPITDIW